MIKVLTELSNMLRAGILPWEQTYIARWGSGKPTDPHQTILAYVQYALGQERATVEAKLTEQTVDGQVTTWQQRMLPTINYFQSAETKKLAKRLKLHANATTAELQWGVFCKLLSYSGNPKRFSKEGAISCYQCMIAANYVLLLHGITPPASHLPGESLADWLDADPFKNSRILFKRAGWMAYRFNAGFIK